MGIFSFLFGKKDPGLPRTNRVFMSRAAANDHLVKYVEQNTASGKKTILVYYFSETRSEIERLMFLKPDMDWVNGSQVSFIPHAQKGEVVFAETYPDAGPEKKLLDMLQAGGYNQKILFFNSLEDSIFVLFGGDRMKKMMITMGMKEDEAIEHRAVTTSLKNAQNKITQRKLVTRKVSSRAEMINMLNGR